MNEIDTLVSEVMLKHGTTPYDPVKAREYYLRTRELKGRRSSGQLDSDARVKTPRVTPKLAPKKPLFTPKQKAKGRALTRKFEDLEDAFMELRESFEEVRTSKAPASETAARKKGLMKAKKILDRKLEELRNEYAKDPAFYEKFMGVDEFQKRQRSAANSRSSSDKKRMTN